MPSYNSCAVFGCYNTKGNTSDISFFSLPDDRERCSLWLKKMDREDLSNKKNRNYYVCESHFVKNDILETGKRKLLKKNCVPMLNLPSVEKIDKGTQVQIFSNGAFTQTDDRRKNKSTQTLKRKLEDVSESDKPIFTSKKMRKEHFHTLCDKFLTPELSQLVKTQSNLKFNFKGNRYEDDYKLFCINLFYTSPDAYKTLQKVLCLPCSNTLTTISIPITTEVNQKLVGSLKAKVDRMTDPEKNCSIILETMALKACLYYNIREDRIVGFHEVNGIQKPDPARKALVMMARGIFENWKQPVGFALLSEFKHHQEIYNWIDTILAKLFEIGLNIRTFVTDLESEYMSASERSICPETPYFYVHNRRIYFIYDPPNLIKSVRDNLMSCDFHFGDSVAKWKHIIQFYEYDKSKNFKLAPKLKDTHINPTKLEKSNVIYATQLLSNAVASGLSNYVDFQVIEESARGTVKFITLMNNLFDALNASSLNDDYQYKRAFNGSEAQITFFYQMLQFFQTLKMNKVKTNRDSTCSDDFITGFQVTIRSILLLFEDLKLEGYTFLLTRRLNLEILEKFFAQIRTSIGTTKTPTSRQFVVAFRKLFFSNLIKPVDKGGNGADDLAKLLIQTNKFEGLRNNIDQSTSMDETGLTTKEEAQDICAHMTCSDYNKLKVPEKGWLVFICGYLLKKCLEQHKGCEILNAYLSLEVPEMDPRTDNRYFRYQEYLNENTNPLPVIPADDFVGYVEFMEQKVVEAFESKHMTSDIGQTVFKKMEDIACPPPCPCFPVVYLRKMYIRVRMFYIVKYNNKLFGMRRGAKKKYFSVGTLV